MHLEAFSPPSWPPFALRYSGFSCRSKLYDLVRPLSRSRRGSQPPLIEAGLHARQGWRSAAACRPRAQMHSSCLPLGDHRCLCDQEPHNKTHDKFSSQEHTTQSKATPLFPLVPVDKAGPHLLRPPMMLIKAFAVHRLQKSLVVLFLKRPLFPRALVSALVALWLGAYHQASRCLASCRLGVVCLPAQAKNGMALDCARVGRLVVASAGLLCWHCVVIQQQSPCLY